MKGRIVIINLLILSGIVALGLQQVSAWERFWEENGLRQVVSDSGPGRPAGEPLAPGPALQDQLFSDFVVISEKNLFAEDRQPESIEGGEEGGGKGAAEEVPPAWAARPILHGVSSLEGKKLAMMTVHEKPSSKGIVAEFKTVRVGSIVQGYRLEEIGDASVTLRWKDAVEVIELSNSQAAQTPKPGGPAGARAAAVNVVKVGSAFPAVSKTGGGGAAAEESPGLEVAVVSGQSGGSQNLGSQPGQAPQTPPAAINRPPQNPTQALPSQTLRPRRTGRTVQNNAR